MADTEWTQSSQGGDIILAKNKQMSVNRQPIMQVGSEDLAGMVHAFEYDIVTVDAKMSKKDAKDSDTEKQLELGEAKASGRPFTTRSGTEAINIQYKDGTCGSSGS